MRKYEILQNYMILFTYMGDMKFSLTVFDSLFTDHFRDMDGNLIIDEFGKPTHGSIVIDLIKGIRFIYCHTIHSCIATMQLYLSIYFFRCGRLY